MVAAAKANAEVEERRLRPVYDALDNYNNKKAIKLVDALLKKKKDFPCAKALKALALVKVGNYDEAQSLLDETLNTAQLLDDSTLQAMTMSYKEMEKPGGIITIYEKAVAQSPTNEEFLSHLFMAYVRTENIASQQKAAMSLYKAHPKNPYYFWAVMTYLMQAYDADDTKKRTMFLSLAERMVTKFVKDDKMEVEEEIRLYIMILEELGKYEEILKIVQSRLGEKIDNTLNERREREVECLQKLHRWCEVNVKCKHILNKHPDQWNYYLTYLDSFLKLKEENYTPDTPIDVENEQPDYSLELVEATLQQLADDNPLLRGPGLAQIHLATKTGGTTTVERLVKYVEKFGSKPCCYSDLREYAETLEPTEREKFIDEIKALEKPTIDNDKEKMKLYLREACVECFTRQLGLYDHLSDDEKSSKAKSYMKKYKEIIKLDIEMNSTEQNTGDIWVLLAANILLDLQQDTKRGSWHAMLFLEEGVESSASNAQFKLVLNYLYAKLGAYGACDELFTSLELKYVMIDSMGYLFTSHAYTSGQFQNTSRLYHNSLKFFASSQKECPEQIIASYKYGSFRQIPDITLFKHRLKKSFQHAHVRVEDCYLKLTRNIHSYGGAKKMLSEVSKWIDDLDITGEKEFWDNRDFLAVENYEACHKKFTKEQQKQSHDENILWLRLRSYILKIVAWCFNGEGPNFIEKLTRDIRTVTGQSSNNKQTWDDIHRPPPCHISFFVEQKYPQLYLALVQLASKLQTPSDTNTTELNENITEIKTILQDNLTSTVECLTISHEENELFNGGSLKPIVFYLETMNIVAMVLSSIKEHLNAIKKSKKKKETNNSSIVDECAGTVKNVCRELRQQTEHLLTQLTCTKEKCLDVQLEAHTIENLFGESNSATVTKVWQRMRDSYLQSIAELTQTLDQIIKFLDNVAR